MAEVGVNMSADWIHSSKGLPREGQHVEFVLDSRNVAMEGIYMHRIFFSHWAEYEVDQVRSWRRLGQGRHLAIIPAPTRAIRAAAISPLPFTNDQLLSAGEGPDVA